MRRRLPWYFRGTSVVKPGLYLGVGKKRGSTGVPPLVIRYRAVSKLSPQLIQKMVRLALSSFLSYASFSALVGMDIR